MNQESIYDSSMLIPCSGGLHEGTYSVGLVLGPRLSKTEGSAILVCAGVPSMIRTLSNRWKPLRNKIKIIMRRRTVLRMITEPFGCRNDTRHGRWRIHWKKRVMMFLRSIWAHSLFVWKCIDDLHKVGYKLTKQDNKLKTKK